MSKFALEQYHPCLCLLFFARVASPSIQSVDSDRLWRLVITVPTMLPSNAIRINRHASLRSVSAFQRHVAMVTNDPWNLATYRSQYHYRRIDRFEGRTRSFRLDFVSSTEVFFVSFFIEHRNLCFRYRQEKCCTWLIYVKIFEDTCVR